MTDLKTRIELLETNQSTMANLCDVLSLVLAETTTNEEHKKRADLARSVFKTLATAFTPSDATYSWEDEARSRRYIAIEAVEFFSMMWREIPDNQQRDDKGNALMLVRMEQLDELKSRMMLKPAVKGEPRTPMTDEEATDEVLNGRW